MVQGFYLCDKMITEVSLPDWLAYLMIAVRILLSSFIIYISLAKLKADFMRNYTLNLYITACIPCDIAIAIQEILKRSDVMVSAGISSLW